MVTALTCLGHGYVRDDEKPTDEQRVIYTMGYEQIQNNMKLFETWH
jgi:hydrogenase/urease accessory protein HupE